MDYNAMNTLKCPNHQRGDQRDEMACGLSICNVILYIAFKVDKQNHIFKLNLCKGTPDVYTVNYVHL